MPSYYKVQYYDVVSLSWKDIQKKFETIPLAMQHIKKLKAKQKRTYRIMGIAGRVRTVMAAEVL